MTHHSITRRRFLQSSAAAAAFTILPSGLARGFAANEKINVGMIGVGGQGEVNLNWLNRVGANIIGLCDVDRNRLARAAQSFSSARTWVDFRRMLEEQKEIDAVMVSTADHTHFPASMLAMKLGKHVCTEKPLCHSVWEARTLGLTAKQCKVTTQLDNEGHATEGLRMLVEWLKVGAIGKIREIHIWSDRPIWPQGISVRPPAKSPPPYLEWDLWLGPAPYRDYHDGLHPFSWRGYWDFGTGALGDMGCHFWDSVFWGLELGHPTTVEAVHEGNSRETGPKWSIVTYQFPERSKDLPAVIVKWYDGHKLPPRPEELEAGRKLPSNGSLLIGETGKILVSDVASPRIIPESKMREFKRPTPFVPRAPQNDHKLDWLQAIREGRPASSNFTDYGGPLNEVVLLGNIAIRSGEKIEWDPVNLKARNTSAADQYIRREYRKGWEF